MFFILVYRHKGTRVVVKFVTPYTTIGLHTNEDLTYYKTKMANITSNPEAN